jgi:AAA15 family ATPase/GTPase|tara:strand:- start:38 stop:526 length:489 start_codon:yes stop_codon:yes gene_type:complete
MKVIDKLSTYAALLGVISAIGGGFYAWGEFNNRISVLEKKPVVNLSSLKQKDKELTKQFDEVLLYANEYKVDLIDRIAKVEEKIKPVDLTLVFKEIAKVRESIAMLDIPVATNLNPVLQSIKALEKLITEAVKQVAIVSKENELQDIQIQEIKLQNKNPLGG